MLRLLLPSLLLAFISLPSNSPSFIHNDDDNNNSSDSRNPIEACNPLNHPNPLALESDRLTVLITGYSPSRIPRLLSLALSYSAHPLVAKVLILWSNPSFAPAALPGLPPTVSLLLPPSSSLSSRFLPLGPRLIPTRSVLVSDDDVEAPPSSLSFAFRASLLRSHRPVVGFFARSHDFDPDAKSWIYTVHPSRYSIVLTKLMILNTEYLYRYSCSEKWKAAREYVEKERNCEDILMNFVAAVEGGEGPLVVEAKGGVRDWGDPRNDDGGGERGLSGRRDHWKKRGECIREFHKVFGEMPLRYSYGKLVEEIGEQGLCVRGGKMVYCDQQS